MADMVRVVMAKTMRMVFVMDNEMLVIVMMTMAMLAMIQILMMIFVDDDDYGVVRYLDGVDACPRYNDVGDVFDDGQPGNGGVEYGVANDFMNFDI